MRNGERNREYEQKFDEHRDTILTQHGGENRKADCRTQSEVEEVALPGVDNSGVKTKKEENSNTPIRRAGGKGGSNLAPSSKLQFGLRRDE